MFSDIGLEWGLRKCAAVNIKRGKIIQEQTQMPISPHGIHPVIAKQSSLQIPRETGKRHTP